MNLSRRNLLTGLTAFIAAPAIIRVAGIMPVKAWIEPDVWEMVREYDLDMDKADLRPGPVYFVSKKHGEGIIERGGLEVRVVSRIPRGHIGMLIG